MTKSNSNAKKFFLPLDWSETCVKKSDTLPILPFETRQDWEAWLKENHAESKGIRLKIAKKEAGTSSVSYAEALDNALCYGWIDGQKAAFDNKYWLQKFTPRTAKSIWSAEAPFLILKLIIGKGLNLQALWKIYDQIGLYLLGCTFL
ncbi:MAG TPA: hypothetical protein VEI53_04230 [Ktedonobacteraceae bacterium]|nr:hypothetical protein [Ktedonobacteraceae bacterium]